MRSRNAAGGGNQTAAANPNASSASASTTEPVIDLERLKRLPLGKYTAKNCYSFLVDRIPWMSNVEFSWRLSGETLLTFPPSVFVDNLRLELNILPYSVVCEIFDVIKEKVLADAAIPVSDGAEPVVNPQLASLWASAPRASFPAVRLDSILSPGNAAPPQTPFTLPPVPFGFSGYHPSKKFAFGAPPVPLFQAQATSQHSLPAFPPPSQHGMQVQPAQMPSQYGTAAATSQMLSQNNVSGAVSSVAFNSPPHTNGQQSSQNDRQALGQSALSAGIPPPPLASQHVQQLSSQHDQQLPSQHVQNPNFVSNPSHIPSNPFSFINLQSPAKVLKPWEVAAIQRVALPQDSGLPVGYKRISMAATIAAAKAERLAQGPTQTMLEKVTWPIMDSFNVTAFHSTRVKYYEAVLASTDSALFRTFKSTLSALARNAACTAFHLDDALYITTPDNTFLSWCTQKFAPANKRQAIAQLKAIKINHRDADHCQSTFVSKFDTLCYAHELLINDIANAQAYWPCDPADYETAPPFTTKEIHAIWLDYFPKQTSTCFSVQLRDCRTFIEQHKETPFNIQVQMLRTKFVAKDTAVLQDGDVYTTTPTFKPRASLKDSAGSVSGGNSGGYLNNSGTRPFNPRAGTPVSESRKRARDDRTTSVSTRGGSLSSKPRDRPVVPGHKRGTACGSVNDHFGLGCTPTSCVIIGTKWQKGNGKNYVWKSSADEPSVTVEPVIWKQLCAARPMVMENLKKAAKLMKQARKNRAGVAALGCDDNDDSDNDINQDDINDAEFVQSDSDGESSDASASKGDAYSSVDVAALHDREASSTRLTEFGHMQQFFGLTRWASNNTFVAKTLIDPGASINIVSPYFASRSCVGRETVNCSIYQGTRKQVSFSEFVLCNFELRCKDNEWRRHTE